MIAALITRVTLVAADRLAMLRRLPAGERGAGEVAQSVAIGGAGVLAVVAIFNVFQDQAVQLIEDLFAQLQP